MPWSSFNLVNCFSGKSQNRKGVGGGHEILIAFMLFSFYLFIQYNLSTIDVIIIIYISIHKRN